jgi:hypothetical protein
LVVSIPPGSTCGVVGKNRRNTLRRLIAIWILPSPAKPGAGVQELFLIIPS